MYLFFAVVFLVYGGMHVYLFRKAAAGLNLGPASGAALGLLMAFMVFSPFLVRNLERGGHDLPATVLAYASFTWMGIVFLFVCSSLVLDVFRLAAWLFGRLPLSAFTAFALPLSAALLIGAYGMIEAGSIRTEHVTLEYPGLDRERLRIAQVSDLHLGLIVGPRRLGQALDIVEAARPDILVSSGDLIDTGSPVISQCVAMLKEVSPPLGKFAVTGNHEFYAGLEKALAATREAGFMVLRQESFSIPGVIRIAGVDDPAGAIISRDGDTDTQVLGARSGGEFILFLKHRPQVDESAKGLFDLQLSGHTHRGQIFPFRIVTMLFYPMDSGLYRVSDTSFLYSSRGTGTWGPPIRFLSPPEVTIIDLVRTKPGGPAA